MRLGGSEYARDQMSRSEAQRRYQNLIHYRIRPMLIDRSRSDSDRILLMKRICREAGNIRAEAMSPAGMGTREELVEILSPLLKPESPASEELKSWIVRCFRVFGAGYEGPGDFD
jgi:hypothetical protein